jgi:hypothetical protein
LSPFGAWVFLPVDGFSAEVMKFSFFETLIIKPRFPAIELFSSVMIFIFDFLTSGTCQYSYGYTPSKGKMFALMGMRVIS